MRGARHREPIGPLLLGLLRLLGVMALAFLASSTVVAAIVSAGR